MRSVAGCLTCRRRRVKCDETRPECRRCRKAGRLCERGEPVFRHEQNASLSRERGTLKTYFSARSSFSSSHTWLTIPEQVTFVAEDPASHYDATADRSLRHGSTPGDASSLTQGSPSDVPVAGEQGHNGSSARPSNNIDFILNPASTPFGIDSHSSHPGVAASPQICGSVESYGPSLQSCISPGSWTSQEARAVEADPEVAFLLRHFSEQPGKWLDLYFLDSYFALDVPIKSLSHPLLKYAACAYAAKHLNRTKGKTITDSTAWPNSDAVDWAWYAAKYYSQAISLLRATLERTHDVDGFLGQQTSPTSSDLQPVDQPTAYDGISDETLAAMAILCNFEYMSASDAEWSNHLSGTVLILDLRRRGAVSLMSSRPSKARKAIFWNLFRQDTFAAFILGVRTRLDIEDLDMWRAAGLDLDDQGLVLPSRGTREGEMKDDMISNALIWILSKVFNYIAMMKEFQRRSAVSNPNILAPDPTTTPSLKDKWRAISHELDIWHEGLPDTFRPCARIERSANGTAPGSGPPKPRDIPEIWFTSDMCASSIQTYHLARILLLVYQPQSSVMTLRESGVFDFLDNYRSIETELRHRSREIFGIAISSPTTSITLHQTQTIFVAAQCLVDEDERRMALDILRRVNADLGWETQYRVQQLLEQWH